MAIRPHSPSPDRMHIYDTTLRDGAQQEGLRLSVADKLRIAALLDELGVSHIEGGWPGANPIDTAFFQAARTLPLRNAQLVAFGATRKPGVRVEDDPQIQALLQAGTDVVTLVAKGHRRHVEVALRTSAEENLAMVAESTRHLVDRGRQVIIDVEHCFDGYLFDAAYTLEVIRVAAEAGAEVVVLCDTNGGMLPGQMANIVSSAAAIGVDLGIHCHNDTGCAVANSIAALEAGAMHVQGTINGYGERTGNADLTTVIANLQLKFGWDVLGGQGLESLTRISNTIAEIANQPLQSRQPYVGKSAFAHKAGLHASAIRLDPNLYQHVDPEAVGNSMRMLISDMAGRANVQIKAEQLGAGALDTDQAGRVSEVVKQRESDGYSYEAADASFELLLLEALGRLDRPFVVTGWTVTTEHQHGREDSVATITIGDHDQERWTGRGNGPVNALDAALRDALSARNEAVSAFRLVDYRVRVLDAGDQDGGLGTGSVVRVLIDFANDERTWTTVGVGASVIDASWEALSDAYLFGVVKHLG